MLEKEGIKTYNAIAAAIPVNIESDSHNDLGLVWSGPLIHTLFIGYRTTAAHVSLVFGKEFGKR